ncbi:MAG: YcgJ family protein [Cyanobium sp.]
MAFRLPVGSLAAVGLVGLTLSPALAQSSTVLFPRPGVICDSPARICYDSLGPSIAITRDSYGPIAAAALSASMAATGNRPDFRLSSGQACVIARRTCYDDGWSMRNVSYSLTRQLFGMAPPVPGPTPGQVSRDRGLCSVSRGSDAVFDGPCLMKRVLINGQNRYEVRLQNGNRFEFAQQGTGYLIRDGFGSTWPVTFVDHGNTGIFRFGGYTLVTTLIGATRQPTATTGQAIGSALGTLLNSLFQ